MFFNYTDIILDQISCFYVAGEGQQILSQNRMVIMH